MSQTLGNGSYTRTNGSPQAGRDSTFPRFHFADVEDPIASAAAGRPIFVAHERVQIIQPGNPNSPVLACTDEYRMRWPDQYKAFRAGHEQVTEGMPLEQWPVLTRTQVLEMKAIGLHSVEQCAGLSDLAVQKIGMGGLRIRELANAYLDDAHAMASTTLAIDRAERAETRAASLERQLEELRPMMDRMHTELMALKNGPSPVDAYVPGNHDPMQAHNQVAGNVVGVPAVSSLDALAAPRRGPGRPRRDDVGQQSAA